MITVVTPIHTQVPNSDVTKARARGEGGKTGGKTGGLRMSGDENLKIAGHRYDLVNEARTFD